MRDIPRIRLEDYHSSDPAVKQAMIDTLGKGLCEFGFVKVTAHGVDPELYKSAYDLYRSLFALDESAKQKYDSSENSTRGYTPFGREHAKDNPHPDLKEFWQVGQELPEGDPESDIFPANIWPTELPELRTTVLDLYRSLEECASILLEAFALYFDLPKETFASMIVRGDNVLRSIHYPPIQGEVAENQVRSAAHEDINLMTLLPQSDGAGLELLSHDGTWMPLNASQGDLIVDTGDMMSRITNKFVPATTHRVVNPPEGSNTARYSMPFFIHPHPKCMLNVLERFVTEDNPAQFPPITAGDFLLERLREIGLVKESSSTDDVS